MMGQRGLKHVGVEELKKCFNYDDRVHFLVYAVVSDQSNFASSCTVEQVTQNT
jgi:hypothetical protein